MPITVCFAGTVVSGWLPVDANPVTMVTTAHFTHLEGLLIGHWVSCRSMQLNAASLPTSVQRLVQRDTVRQPRRLRLQPA